MKKTSLFLMVLLMSLMVNAQKGKKQLNIALGFAKNSIPVYVGLDFWIHEDISLGGEVGWGRYNWEHKDNDYHQDVFSFSFNGNYHFARILGIPEEFDIYAGLNIGFYHWTDNDPFDYWDNHTSGLGLGIQVGFRYYFSSKFGFYLEGMAGNQISSGKIGLSILF